MLKIEVNKIEKKGGRKKTIDEVGKEEQTRRIDERDKRLNRKEEQQGGIDETEKRGIDKRVTQKGERREKKRATLERQKKEI